jgi:Rap guanine nucleotide exchange factor 1
VAAEFIYQEAFLTTYRTFISPRDLIDKLLYRFNKFHHMGNGRKKLARNAFSLLIRVIDELRWVARDSEIDQTDSQTHRLSGSLMS